jgi:hypothetical protein
MEFFTTTFGTGAIGFDDEISHCDNLRYFVMPVFGPDLLTLNSDAAGRGSKREDIVEEARKGNCPKLHT